MVVARERTPVPSWLTMLTRSQGMESASGEGTLVTALPVTRLPSFASQEGPAKCLPKGLPSLSKSWASGAFSVQENCAASPLAGVQLVSLGMNSKKKLFACGGLQLLRELLRSNRERKNGERGG